MGYFIGNHGNIIGMYSDQNTSPEKNFSFYGKISYSESPPVIAPLVCCKITPFLWFFQLELFRMLHGDFPAIMILMPLEVPKIPLVVGNTGILYGNHMGLLGFYGIMYGIIDTGWQNPMIS